MKHSPAIGSLVLSLLAPAVLYAQVFSNGDFEMGTKGWALSQQEMARAELGAVDSDSSSGGKAGTGQSHGQRPAPPPAAHPRLQNGGADSGKRVCAQLLRKR